MEHDQVDLDAERTSFGLAFMASYMALWLAAYPALLQFFSTTASASDLDLLERLGWFVTAQLLTILYVGSRFLLRTFLGGSARVRDLSTLDGIYIEVHLLLHFWISCAFLAYVYSFIPEILPQRWIELGESVLLPAGGHSEDLAPFHNAVIDLRDLLVQGFFLDVAALFALRYVFAIARKAVKLWNLIDALGISRQVLERRAEYLHLATRELLIRADNMEAYGENLRLNAELLEMRADGFTNGCEQVRSLVEQLNFAMIVAHRGRPGFLDSDGEDTDSEAGNSDAPPPYAT